MAATSTLSTASRATAAWRPRPVWPVPTNACSAGGGCGGDECRGMSDWLLWLLFLQASYQSGRYRVEVEDGRPSEHTGRGTGEPLPDGQAV